MRTFPQVMGVGGESVDDGRSVPSMGYPSIARADERHLQAEVESIAPRSSVSNAVRLVALLAFGQSLLFLVIWLFLCASAGATPVKKAEFKPDLQLSTYEPAKQRDPFSKSGVGQTEAVTAVGVQVSLQLEGILFQSTNPAAIVNGHLLELNKTVKLTVGAGEYPIKAVEISRDRVVVEANGRRVELRLDPTAKASISK